MSLKSKKYIKSIIKLIEGCFFLKRIIFICETDKYILRNSFLKKTWPPDSLPLSVKGEEKNRVRFFVVDDAVKKLPELYFPPISKLDPRWGGGKSAEEWRRSKGRSVGRTGGGKNLRLRFTEIYDSDSK